MSRENKVNPGMYTQRGRLTQDDAARELRKQSAFASPHTWQPVNRELRPAPAGAAARDTERSDAEAKRETRPPAKARPASRVTKNSRGTAKAVSSKARSKAVKAKTTTAKPSATRQAKRTATVKATGKAKTRAVPRTATKRRRA